jgi:LysR family nod box-dependent transcriptional activator
MDDLGRRLRSTNLNLLPILRAVLRHRNLTRAAEELNITQSGVSNSLRQLRVHFGDQLLVRDGRRLRLTDRAKQLMEPLEQALSSVALVLANPKFDAATSAHHFRLATADYVAAITAPEMAAVMSREAPRITLQLITARGRSIGDLRSGEIDMVIAPRQILEAAIFDAPSVMRELTIEPLGREPFVCLARDDDEAFARGLTREEYLARPHASFHLDLAAHASLEHAYLLEHRVPQFNRILTSDFTVLPLIAARSDCIVLAPRSLARLAVGNLPLQIGESPLPAPDLDLVMTFLARRRDEPELAWLCGLLRRCVATSLGV